MTYNSLVYFLGYYILDVVSNKILELINMPGLTRNNIASYLQVSFLLLKVVTMLKLGEI